MNITQLKQSIKRELPGIMRDDPEIRQLILNLARNQFADKQETESRFDRLLEELRRDREENWRKWEATLEKWEEKWEAHEKKQDEKWEAYQKKRDEEWKTTLAKWDEKWEAYQKKQDEKWEAHEKKQDEKWEENNRKWRENQDTINRMLKKYESDVGALGARWGLRSEASFRNALQSILEESFNVEVLNINEFDDEGHVFGRPEQIELDIIIKNGLLIICEIKSSVGRSQMYTFARKVEFYEKKHNTKASRKLIISPWITERAKKVAKKLNIEIYSYADEVTSL